MEEEISFSQLLTWAIEEGQIPRYVYKYRALNNFTEEIFSGSKLWFSRPDSFNDPFDCQIVVQGNNTADEIANFVRQIAPAMSNKDVKAYSRFYSKNNHEWKKKLNETTTKHINNYSICCFAGNGDNILMWSHYGDSHKGICIKFDMLADPDFFYAPFKVKYQTEYPGYNHLRNNSKLVESLIITKSECWKYEEELRVLKKLSGPVGFKKEAIVEVIFGCTCEAANVKHIKSLILANKFPNVKFKKAVKSTSSYTLIIKDLK